MIKGVKAHNDFMLVKLIIGCFVNCVGLLTLTIIDSLFTIYIYQNFTNVHQFHPLIYLTENMNIKKLTSLVNTSL